MKVADGVFQFKVPMPRNRNNPHGGLRYTLVYAVEIPGGWVVIDAGIDSDEGFEAFQQQLSEAGLAPQDVTNIVITHGHPDHAGLANRIRALTGARLAMHRLDATNPYVLTFRPGVQPPTIDLLLEGGEEVVPDSGLWTILTPGHTPGHLCLHDRRRRLLFAGDHLLPTITPNVSLFPGDEGDPLELFLEAHRNLKELKVEMVHPAHGHSFPDLDQRVDEILEHHRARTSEMLAQVQDSPKTAWQITSGIHWNVGTWDELDTATRRAAWMETMAHLQHLVLGNELIKQERGSVVILEELRQMVDLDREWPVALVGVGRLGRATLNDPDSTPEGFKVIAAFDADPRQVGQTVRGLVVQPMDRLQEVLQASNIHIAIVAVPAPYVQGVVDQLVQCNVEAIVNYAPIEIQVPPHVKLRNIDPVLALQSMTFYLRPT